MKKWIGKIKTALRVHQEEYKYTTLKYIEFFQTSSKAIIYKEAKQRAKLKEYNPFWRI